MQRIDLTGYKFGRLTAQHVVNNSKTGTYWSCLCECGKIANVFIGHLRSGKTNSCGCLALDSHRTHGQYRTPAHISWCSMRARCLSKNTNGYDRYGGRGIKICSRWDDFANFLEDMGERPEGQTLDRKDSNGDYTPDNCKWSTLAEQGSNMVDSRRYVLDGVEYNTAALAGKKYNVSHVTILRWCRENRSPKLGIDCHSYNIYP